MARQYPDPQDPVIKRGSYVQICDTDDEWEDVIGVLEEFYTEAGEPCKWNAPDRHFAQVRIPTRRKEQEQMRLHGVNDLTGYVRYELQKAQDIKLIPVNQLEHFNPDDL